MQESVKSLTSAILFSKFMLNRGPKRSVNAFIIGWITSTYLLPYS